ncbi:MAG: DUF359 domain-containing protein [Candidatus Methanomethylicaceae archaeon]|nr:DUF359 domain-containing protein [Candidatus Verstraetearchaeota archaeon]
MGKLKLPESMRTELSKPLGLLLTGSPEENVKQIINLMKNNSPPKIVVIGDFVLFHFLSLGIIPNLGIYDKKTKRLPFSLNLSPSAIVNNPAGYISDEAISIIKNLLNSQGNHIVYVEGEEDLLTLPAILYSPINSFVIYGIPDKGMALIIVNEEIKKKVMDIIEKFEKIP